ncbi:hypothetical protein L3X39_07295 [Sabulilitoribacter multivorans]|uniref:Uncharacterized protein n=1 Tax=Flaviramulus multivorans TaxID=1304750 RepID=A0ABS9IIY0_9FLAO|nr:hypothetical protein [Flaviramulus multivorans]MCF7560438.1 hypothetical protein [Flaviramulus multivorans]
MKTPLIILKASIMATCIFWTILFSRNFESEMVPFIIVSFIPISICCGLTIMLTIYPFFKLKKDVESSMNIFKKYFPFYAIFSFGLCLYGSITIPDIICFFASAFFTTMQTWVWFGKVKGTTN